MYFASEHAQTAVVVSSVCLGFAITAVVLRQYAQALKGKPFAADAWFLIAALVVSSGLVGIAVYGAEHGGLGWPIQMLTTPAAGLRFQKLVFAGQILWAAAITLVRISLLIFYRRVFYVVRPFMIANNIMIGLCAGYWLSNFVATLCTYQWKRQAQTDINYPSFLLISAVINMVLDIATLTLPLFVIRTLHVSTRKKIILGAIFWLGIFCIVASIVRVHYFVQLSKITQRDRSFSGTTYYCFLWSVVEPLISIVAACLPASAPLINKETRGFSVLFESVKSLFSRRTSRSGSEKLSNGDSSSNLGDRNMSRG